MHILCTLADDAALGNDLLKPFIVTKPLPEELTKIAKQSYQNIHLDLAEKDHKTNNESAIWC